MQHQSAAPGPEVGWGVGLVGFIASVLAGWFLDAGVGFVLFLLVFWGAIGALFAFLVERSTIEERDRVDELQNTRLATLAEAPGSVAEAARIAARREQGPMPSPSAVPTDRHADGRSPGRSPRDRATPLTPSAKPRSPREYREAKIEASRRDQSAA